MSTNFLHGVEVVEIDDGIRPIQTVRSAIIGLVGTADAADAAAFPLDTPVLVTGPRQAALLGEDGELLAAFNAIREQGASVVVVVRVAEGEDDAETLANVIGSPAAQTGCHALTVAQQIVGQTPRILIAPGFTGDRSGGANPVVAALKGIAAKLRAVVVADGPNTTEAEAIAAAGDHGSDRVYLVDPWVKAFDVGAAATVVRPPSAYAAGVIAATDVRRGFWWSPSNTELVGVTGTARAVEFHLSNSETEANRLNEAKVATIVRQNGFRLWGNRGLGVDPMWAFLSVRRAADFVAESVERAHLWAMDRPMSAQLIVDIRDSVQAYIDELVGLGALIGGRCWFDEELNTPAVLASGQVYLNFDLEPPAPLERLTFRAYRNAGYYEALALDVAATQ